MDKLPTTELINQTIAAQLEARFFLDFNCVNTRDFSPATSSLFRDKANFWRAHYGGTLQPKTCGLHEWVEIVRETVDRYPDYRLQATSIATTVDRANNRAQTFLNVNDIGMFPGVVKKVVLRVDWRRVNGKWLNCGHTCFPGMD